MLTFTNEGKCHGNDRYLVASSAVPLREIQSVGSFRVNAGGNGSLFKRCLCSGD